jgi:hypothetical protein
VTKKIFLNNKYSVWYFNIIDGARNRISLGYSENHHIIPKSMGGSNAKKNIVSLTAKEHYICHLLLTKSVVDEFRKKMKYAFWRMCNSNLRRYKPTSRMYEIGKSMFIEAQTGHPAYLISHSAESKKKISAGMSATLAKLSKNEMSERMAKSCCNPVVYTQARADKISASSTGKKDSKEECRNKSIAASKRNNTHLIEMGKARKNRPWSAARRTAQNKKKEGIL